MPAPGRPAARPPRLVRPRARAGHPAKPAMAPVRRLRAVQVISQAGDGAFYVTSAVYLVRLGWSPVAVGILLSASWALGAALSPASGRWADRRGLAVPAATATGLCVLGLGVLAATGRAGSIAGFAAYAVGQSAWGGLRAALVQAVTPAAAVLAERARLQRLGNAAIAVGALAGGAALAAGPGALRAVLGLDAAAYLVVTGVLRRFQAAPQAAAPGAGPARPRRRLSSAHYAVTAAAALLYLYMPMLSVALPLLVAGAAGVPTWTISACFAANTLGVMAIQGRAAAAVTTAAAARRSLLAGGGLLAGSCLLIWTALNGTLPSGWPALAVLVAGLGLQVLGEVRFAAAAWDLGYRLAPADRAASWQATYGTAVPLARCLGPALLAPLAGLAFGWAAVAAVFGAGTLILAAAARRAASMPADTVPPDAAPADALPPDAAPTDALPAAGPRAAATAPPA